jgi:hypothetical protein
MSLFLVIAVFWPVPPKEGITIEVPRSWLLGEERSPCTLRMSDVSKLLGPADMFSYSMWHYRKSYERLGVRFWFEWECPMMLLYPAWGLAPDTRAALRVLGLACARPLLWAMEAKFVPRESLIEVGWSAWGMSGEWRFE